MTPVLTRRLAHLILAAETFTADDLTDDGRVALDGGHAPNARQNGIGAFVNRAAASGWITFTGTVVRSRAPHRKGGAIRVWTGTAAGRAWAQTITTTTKENTR